jgi:hypothetical protein
MAVDHVLKYSKAKGTNRLVLLVLAESVNGRTGNMVCWPSLARIADRANLEPSRVCKILTELEDLGEIRRQRAHGGRNQRTHYFLTVGPKNNDTASNTKELNSGLAGGDTATRSASNASQVGTINGDAGKTRSGAPHDIETDDLNYGAVDVDVRNINSVLGAPDKNDLLRRDPATLNIGVGDRVTESTVCNNSGVGDTRTVVRVPHALNRNRTGIIHSGKSSNQISDSSLNISRPRNSKGSSPFPGFKETMALYSQLFSAKIGTKPDIAAIDGKLLSELLRNHGAPEVQVALRLFFERPIAWVEKNGAFTLRAFKHCYNQILAQRQYRATQMRAF